MALRAFNEIFPDEDAARAWFEKSRCPHGPECPKCGSVGHSSWLKTPRRWNCIACHHQFSVTAGTPMSALFAGDDGSLLGKDWLRSLRVYDQRITSIARGQQRHGRKPRGSTRYRKAVASLRGWIRTEVGRVLNALVATNRPAPSSSND